MPGHFYLCKVNGDIFLLISVILLFVIFIVFKVNMELPSDSSKFDYKRHDASYLGANLLII